MNYIEKDLASFIEERLQVSFNELKNTKEYKKLKNEYNTLNEKITELINNNIRNI